ncbi:MAG: FliH/SctL family protein [Gemmatimonadales bacterium]|nr:FliH/SctL family protein [Gemmatimonadales bacterium]
MGAQPAFAPFTPAAPATPPASPAAPTARFAVWPAPELGHVARRPEQEAPRAAEQLAEATAQAYEQGFAEGVSAARAEADRRLEGALRALAGAVDSLLAVQAAVQEEVEEHLAALAVAVAQQVVQRELATDPSWLRDCVTRALAGQPAETAFEVRLHPDDLAALDGHLELFAPGGRHLDVRWVADPALERGGYVVETPHRVLDGRLDPALADLYQRLRDA